MRNCLLEEIKKVIELLNYFKMIRLLFFKCVIANRMLLTVTITVVFVERNFSKLKLIKSYLWLTMLQEMLNELDMVSIEMKL